MPRTPRDSGRLPQIQIFRSLIILSLLALLLAPRAGAASCPAWAEAPERSETEGAAAPRLLLPGDHRVRPGQVVHLAWSAADSVSELEIILSVGGEHPFTTRVSPRLDPRRRGFDWRVPDIPGAELRLRLRYNRGGREIDGLPGGALTVRFDTGEESAPAGLPARAAAGEMEAARAAGRAPAGAPLHLAALDSGEDAPETRLPAPAAAAARHRPAAATRLRPGRRDDLLSSLDRSPRTVPLRS